MNQILMKGLGYMTIKRQKRIAILFFVSLPVLYIIIFNVIPFMNMIFSSFFSMNYSQNFGFVGFDNYRELLTTEPFIQALFRSGYYLLGGLLQLFLAVIIAAILCNKISLKNAYKGALLFPYLINGIAVGFIFKHFYTHGSVLDTLLNIVGLTNLPYWLRDQNVNNFSLVFVSIWRYIGYYVILIISAMLTIDRTIYEAATIDGASKRKQFIHITLPNIFPVIFACAALKLASALSEFEIPYIVSSMGANNTSTFLIEIHKVAFKSHRVGLASAMAVFISVLILILTTLTMGILYYYQSKDENGIMKKLIIKKRKRK